MLWVHEDQTYEMKIEKKKYFSLDMLQRLPEDSCWLESKTENNICVLYKSFSKI